MSPGGRCLRRLVAFLGQRRLPAIPGKNRRQRALANTLRDGVTYTRTSDMISGGDGRPGGRPRRHHTIFGKDPYVLQAVGRVLLAVKSPLMPQATSGFVDPDLTVGQSIAELCRRPPKDANGTRVLQQLGARNKRRPQSAVGQAAPASS